MNGIILTIFIELVEENFGYQMVDKIIMQTNLHSKGIYTSASEYDSSELDSLMEQLKNHTNCSIHEIINQLGKRLFLNFKTKYNSTLLELESSTANLILLENYITTTLRKLYDKLNQPKIEIAHYSKNKLVLNCHMNTKHIGLVTGFLYAAIEMTNQNILLRIDQSDNIDKELQCFILEQIA